MNGSSLGHSTSLGPAPHLPAIERLPVPRRVCFPSACWSCRCPLPILKLLISSTPSFCSQRGAREQQLRATWGPFPLLGGSWAAPAQGPTQLTDGNLQFCLHSLRRSWRSGFMRCLLLTVAPSVPQGSARCLLPAGHGACTHVPRAAGPEHGRAPGHL